MQADPPAASPAASPTHPQRARLGRASRSLRALTLLALPALILDHVASPRPVSDRSMQPTLNPDTNRLRRDWVLQNRWATNYRGVRLGDVVSLWSPDDPNVELVKRVLALPEDTIRALDGRRIRIPAGHCWVEGDEPFHSTDSNEFGPVPLNLISSRIDGIVWPLRSVTIERDAC